MARVKHRSYRASVQRHIKGARSRALEAVGRTIAGEVGRLLRRGQRTGETYTVPGTGVEYTASAPGEPPAPRTGDLAGSYTFYASGNSVVVGSPLLHSRLEFGLGYAEPRPHLRPAARRTSRRNERLVRREFARG